MRWWLLLLWNSVLISATLILFASSVRHVPLPVSFNALVAQITRSKDFPPSAGAAQLTCTTTLSIIEYAGDAMRESRRSPPAERFLTQRIMQLYSNRAIL